MESCFQINLVCEFLEVKTCKEIIFRVFFHKSIVLQLNMFKTFIAVIVLEKNCLKSHEFYPFGKACFFEKVKINITEKEKTNSPHRHAQKKCQSFRDARGEI